MVSFHCVAVDVCAAVTVENEARLGLPEGQLTGLLDFRSEGWGDSEIEILASALATRGTGVWLDEPIFPPCSSLSLCCRQDFSFGVTTRASLHRLVDVWAPVAAKDTGKPDVRNDICSSRFMCKSIERSPNTFYEGKHVNCETIPCMVPRVSKGP